MDGNSLIQFSQQVLQDSTYDPEVRARCAVSRAYYGAFHLALARLESAHEFERPKDGKGIHMKVIRNVRDLDRHLGERLLGLFDKRVTADYRLDRPMDGSDAQRQVSIAARVGSTLSTV